MYLASWGCPRGLPPRATHFLKALFTDNVAVIDYLEPFMSYKALKQSLSSQKFNIFGYIGNILRGLLPRAIHFWEALFATLFVFWYLRWNRVICNFVYWKSRYMDIHRLLGYQYVYCKGQFRFSENLMYGEKIWENFCCPWSTMGKTTQCVRRQKHMKLAYFDTFSL